MRRCEGCGCTDTNACLDEKTGEPCAWVEGYDGDLCTACAAVALAMVGAPQDEMEAIRAETARRLAERLCTYCGDALDDYDAFETACGNCREEVEAAAENNAPRVEIFSESDANRAIAQMRCAR